MSDETACCAHLYVEHKAVTNFQGITRGWWQCRDCEAKFMPTATAQWNHRKLREALEDLLAYNAPDSLVDQQTDPHLMVEASRAWEYARMALEADSATGAKE